MGCDACATWVGLCVDIHIIPPNTDRDTELQLTARVVVFGVHVKSEWRQARERILSA